MSISNNEIDILYSFFDQIIPSSDDMPCATEAIDKKDFEILISEISIYELSIDQIIYFIKREPTSRVGGGASSLTEIQKGEILELMESIIPDDFLMFIEIVYLLYYSKSEIHEKIGWNTDELAEENKMEAFDDSILNNIKKRDPFWRKA